MTQYEKDTLAMMTPKEQELLLENARLREALYRTLNYIENTESKLAIKLGCGDAARAALAGKA